MNNEPRIKSEFSEQFTNRMRCSMEVSYHKYGPIKDAYPHKFDAIANLKKRLDLYEKTGNADYLVDVANFAMIEFILPAHSKYHDTPTDGGEGRKRQGGGPAVNIDNYGNRVSQ